MMLASQSIKKYLKREKNCTCIPRYSLDIICTSKWNHMIKENGDKYLIISE